LLLDLPLYNNQHNGGELRIGPDNYVYLTVGEVGRPETKATNNKEGKESDGTGGILRITKDGRAVHPGILDDSPPLNMYYAYGLRNSFGIDFDPITGNMWDTENGEAHSDEINLVKPGFNSGWWRIMGFTWIQEGRPTDLVDFDGKGKYHEPALVFEHPVGLTAIKFLNSDKLGTRYENDMFVSDFNRGNIYHFDLNDNRTELLLNGSLEGKKIVTGEGELEELIFGKAPGGVVDLQVGPDGYLYVLTLPARGTDCSVPIPECAKNNLAVQGAIYRIVLKSD
jgi:glucose/arabinose dehydrogenase